MELLGLHHLTAVTGQAALNLAFYTRVLGLRLVKKTVNQDDVSAYHLFYGDKLGSAGTEVTFFDWPASPRKIYGKGTIATTALRVPSRAALDWWAERLTAQGVDHKGIMDWGGAAAIAFTDPEGQNLLLVDDGGAPGGVPWEQSPVPPDKAIRGLHAVTLIVQNLAPTARVLTEVLGFRQVGSYPFPENESRRVVRFATGAGGPGTEVHIAERPELRPGQVGIGGVHHVAFRTPDQTEQRAWRDRIARAGLGVTPLIDRFYFSSIYFREPGGALFEIATDGPGFATDEDPAHLGERLALPPFLEPHRARIEAGLRPLVLKSS
ncbi:MAG TPA: ring-cleaving dioxygenase [Ardenticatenaceae bacterium]|nr:ring-cleaving dioxygenase [Ardenticatenaceae bacterium]